MGYKVAFMNENEKVIDTRHFDAESDAEIKEKAEAYIQKAALFDYASKVSWEASRVVASGSMTQSAAQSH